MVKVGIIGCGKIAQVRHIPEYLDNPNAKLTGLYDLNLQRAKELAEKYDCKSYESVEEMLADPEIDAVSVCVAAVSRRGISSVVERETAQIVV